VALRATGPKNPGTINFYVPKFTDKMVNRHGIVTQEMDY
jgi:hypothetical protein